MTLSIKTKLNKHEVIFEDYTSLEHYRLVLVFPYLKQITLSRSFHSTELEEDENDGWIISSNFNIKNISNETLFDFDLEEVNHGLMNFDKVLKRGRQSPFGGSNDVFLLVVNTRFGRYKIEINYDIAYELFHSSQIQFLKLVCDHLPERFYEELQVNTPFPICLK